MVTTELRRIFAEEISVLVQEEVRLKGWVYQLRILGKTAFIILRDCTGEAQCVIASEALKEHKLKVEDVGDSNMLPGVVIDKFEFRKANEQLMECVKISDPGNTEFQIGDIVPATTLEEVNAQVEASDQKPAKSTRPRAATASIQLLGITKAAVQSESFISAASFQETTKVLTEAALGGKTDELLGLKENVILGHMVPAGTGFRGYHAKVVEKLVSEEELYQAERAAQEREAQAAAAQAAAAEAEKAKLAAGQAPAEGNSNTGNMID